jgi:hypothetical protein
MVSAISKVVCPAVGGGPRVAYRSITTSVSDDARRRAWAVSISTSGGGPRAFPLGAMLQDARWTPPLRHSEKAER